MTMSELKQSSHDQILVETIQPKQQNLKSSLLSEAASNRDTVYSYLDDEDSL